VEPTRKIRRPVLRYHGGKFRLAERIVQLFPPHRVYCEPFSGGASVLMHKRRSRTEILNDLDTEVINVFWVLQCPRKAKRLFELLRLTPFARDEFNRAYKKGRTDIERARRTIIKSFMGFGSDSITRQLASRVGFNSRISTTMKTGFRMNSIESSVSAARDWMNYPPEIDLFCQRLRGVVIENRDALVVMRKNDRPDCLHFVDPPYLHALRTQDLKRYKHEMSESQHVKLAELLHTLKGMVIICGYAGSLYEELYKGWEQMWWRGRQFCHGGKFRTECVWMNPAASMGSQKNLFQ
jgi:DNA adenine methylase